MTNLAPCPRSAPTDALAARAVAPTAAQPLRVTDGSTVPRRGLFGLLARWAGLTVATGLGLSVQAQTPSSPATTPAAPSALGDDAERDNLARISFELERLQEMVVLAARQAPSGQRISFRYEWLARDLELLRRGVSEHLDAPRQPRSVPPLRGEYRQ